MSQIYNASTNSFSGKIQNMNELGQVMWHITDQCMLNCAICFTRKMRKDMNFLQKEEIYEYIILMKKLGVRKVDLSGGEPLLYPYLPLLVTSCIQEGIAVTVTTSGLGKKENIDWILKNWSLFSRIILSLDGAEKLHNFLRGYEKAFESFWFFQNQLKEVGCNTIRVNTIVSKKLFEEEEQRAVCRLIEESKVSEWCLIEPYPINKTEKFDGLVVKNVDFCNFVAQCKSFFALSNVNIIQRTNLDYKAYWSLFCDGYLYYSSNGQYYDVKIRLTDDNLDKIRTEVMKRPQTYILKI